ncbi:MAG: hypothetical protein ACOVOV_10130 [Dolichospermum sp.]|jgi:hypothetical protein
MATNKLLNFRCPDELLAAIEAYGREHYPARQSKRGNIDYDQSKTIRDILISGLESLTNGEVRLDRESVRHSPSKSDNSFDLTELMDRINKLESQQPTLDPDIEARLDAMEAALLGK